MLKLSKATRIGLDAMVELARGDGTPISTGQLASRLGITPHHLAKVLQQLAKQELIQSSRGPGGGHCLLGLAKNITLMDIIGVFEWGRTRNLQVVEVEGGLGDTSGPGGALRRVFAEIDEQVAFTLKSISLKTLVGMEEH